MALIGVPFVIVFPGGLFLFVFFARFLFFYLLQNNEIQRLLKKYTKELNFTGAKHIESKIYNVSTITRKCSRCGQEHGIFYKKYEKCGIRLVIACPNSKPRIKFLPYEENPLIPTL